MKELFERRSCRRFTSQPIREPLIRVLLEAAMHAPSANNQQAWEFVVVMKEEQLTKLSKVSRYASSLLEAKAAVVVLGNENHMKSEKYWQQDLAAATQNLLLMAEHHCLGAVWLGVAPDEERMRFVSQSVQAPAHVRPFAIVALGYPVEKQKQQNRYNADRCHYEIYGSKKGNE